MNNRIILCFINSKSRCYGATEDTLSAIQPNIIMALLSSYLKSKNIEVQMIDETFNYSIPKMIEVIKEKNPILLGIICIGANPSSSTMSMVGAIKFFEEFNKQKEGIKTFILGGHPSVLPERTLKETDVDYVIRGEGYNTITNLFNALVNNTTVDNIKGLTYFKDNEFINQGFDDLVNLNELPPVNWSLMNPNKYRAHNWHCFNDINNRKPYGVIWTTMGCPFNCSYCVIHAIFGKHSYRMRDMKLVLQDIDILVKQYGVKHIKIMDELFVTKHPRMDEFCDGLEERQYNLNMWGYGRIDTVDRRILRRLKKVGFNWISYGLESASQKTLNSINKGLDRNYYDEVLSMTKEEGISICADFIVGLWLDSKETLEETYQFCLKYNFEWLNIYPCFAYPGTQLYDEMISNKIIDIPQDWETYALYGYKCFPLPSKYMTSQEILRWRDEYFIKYHSRPEYLEMIKQKFGLDTVKHIENMTKVSLKRKILE